MSFYELPAETRGYYFFESRNSEDTRPHFHRAIEFLFVKAGKQEIVLDGEKRVLSVGDGCFIDSFHVHSLPADPDAVSYAILGDRAYFEDFFTNRPGYTLPRFFTFSDFYLLDSLYDLCKRPYKEEDKRLLFSGIARMLTAMIAASAPPVVQKENKQGSLICDILRYTQDNLGADLSLAALSTRYGYSREHLSRMLHRYINENWNEYVNRLRVGKASWLLKENGNKNVLEILLECGFNSPNTFYRAYKKEFSQSPRRNIGEHVNI